jgi:hypothetical protein
LIKRIYFENQGNAYGFNYQSGMFFINNVNYDFKISIDNYDLIPFQCKSISTLFDQGDINTIKSWNVGYKLITDNESFKYTMIIYVDNQVYFKAEHYLSNKLINSKQVKLH